MDNSIYIALSKQAAASRQLDIVANNIANANTTAYKSEDMVFSKYLQKNSKDKAAFANDIGTARDLRQGAMKVTGNPLDLALDGNGYFAVQTQNGELYTRAGNFALNDQGELVNSDGYQVLDPAGQAIVFEPEDKHVTVYADGRIEVDGEDRTSVGVFNFDDQTALKKVSGNLYSASTTPDINQTPRIAQGMLESSNVNPVLEMTKMINLQSDFSRTSNFISSMYDVQDNAIRTLSKE